MFEFTRINTKETAMVTLNRERFTLESAMERTSFVGASSVRTNAFLLMAPYFVPLDLHVFLALAIVAHIFTLMFYCLGQIRPLDCGFCWFVTPDQLWRSQPLTTWPLRNWSSFGHVLMSESCLLFDFQVDVRRAISCVVAVACVSTKASTQLGLPWTLHSVSESDCRLSCANTDVVPKIPKRFGIVRERVEFGIGIVRPWIHVFFPLGPATNAIFGGFGAVLFSGYIIYDTENLIKRFTYDEYIWASVTLYLDILNLFLSILRMLRQGDN
ncbi:hypothetical protein E3N88_27250 [Mikania micrantha]|uniref:Uncharacterized protein n=1 Tax=Mikania micrantha TaxID=192012 RepID=A0A5N6MW52_9ASTR|nr:hypothetical protein E3N88_27250 [Mikania micrantha]